MVKKILMSTIIFFLYGCTNYEFVYKKNRTLVQIENQTVFSIEGDDKPIILAYLSQRLGISEATKPNYLLEIKSNKNQKVQAINQDSTASKNKISYEIQYVLKNLKTNCKILENTFNSSDSYDSRSSGYSFNTDMTEIDISKKIVEENIEKFFNYLNVSLVEMACKN